MSNLFESLRFRVHVRNLLYDYVKKHCTIDYVTFTEGIVSEFFEDVQLVPLTDPYSLTLPIDPLDALEKMYAELPSYVPEDHDVMQISQETVAYVKGAFKPRTGKCMTERIVMNESYGTTAPREPCYPALTRRARQSTKKLGTREPQRPSNLKDLLKEHKLAVLEVGKLEEPNGNLEDTLKVEISIQPGEQPAVKSLLRSTLNRLRIDKPYTNRHLESTFLCNQFPTEPGYTPPEDVFMPIFPRRRHISISAPATEVGLADFKSLVENASAPFEPVDVANFDEDIPRQNMVLVGGWQAIKSSPPSTPSSNASGHTEIDELDDIRFPSSPCTTPPPVQELENLKMMDPILIPRSRRIGGNSGISPHILRGKTLKTFLAPLISETRIERDQEPAAGRVPSPTPSSLIGQPPSALDTDHDIETEANYPDFHVGLEIQKVCEGYAVEPDFFLDEMIDDKAALLMEVPTLPQPNDFPKDFYLPKSLSDLVIPSAAQGGQCNPNLYLPPSRLLKKVRGCQSLSLQLSWVPFTVNKHPPALVEILDVVDIFLQEGADYKQALEMLDSVAVEPSSSESLADVSLSRGLKAGPEDLICNVPTEDFLIMMNRKERSPLGKRSTSVHGHSESGNSDLDILNDGGFLAEPLAHLNTDSVDTGGHSDRPLSVQDQLLEDDSPVEFADCGPAADQEGSISVDLPHTLPGRQFSGGLADFDLGSKPELSRHSLGSFAFAQLRARKVSVPRIERAPVVNRVASHATVEPPNLRRGPPLDVCDTNTIYLEEATTPQSVHKYMACLEFIQKQALVRALASRNCAVELVERRDLAGVDLILDTDTAVTFLNLFSLSVRCDAYVDKIAKGSWKFDRLLIVFEAYGELSAKRAKHHRPLLPPSHVTIDRSSEPHAYTPPIVKALKKFKRDLCIAEACGAKRTATIVQYGFADTVEEAALFTRLYGDWCEASDRTYGVIWGNREWLDADILENDEDNLASLKGFNHFSASIILYQVSLEEFINLLPEERVSTFGAYILPDHIRLCNSDLDARLEAMQTGQDSELEVN